MRYNFLDQFIDQSPNRSGLQRNWFVSVKAQDIISSEERLGYSFPKELRKFYEEVGYGCLSHPYTASEDYIFYGSNMILSPSSIADIVLEGAASGLIIPDVYDLLLEPGDLPFFEIGDSSRFLVMKMNSNNPNAVWHMGRPLIKVEDSFEKFIWRLYYESPSYYDDILDAWNAQNQLG